MRLTTYFRAMEAADARIRLLADHNVTDTGQYYHAQMRCNHLRTGLIRRMEARDQSHKMLNDYIFARDALDDMVSEERAR